MALKASNADQRLLLELQETDTRIQRYTGQLRSLPQTARIEALDAELAQLDRAVLERLGEHDDIETEVRRIEADVQTVEARLKRDRDRLPTLTDAKTARATEHEIATLEKRRTDLEDMELEAMQRQEDAAAALQQARDAAQAARDERDRLDAERSAAASDIEAQLAAARTERGEREAPIPADLLALYEKQRARYGIGATLLQRRTSVASGVELTAAELHQVRQAADDDVLLDANSSAILVRTEESGL